MPLFTEEELRDHDERPTLEEALERLPVVVLIDRFEIRPYDRLVDLGHDDWLEEMSHFAWLARYRGWDELLHDGELLDVRDHVRREWAEGFGRAVRLLAEQGAENGGETDPHRWASWLAHELSKPNAYVERLGDEAEALFDTWWDALPDDIRALDGQPVVVQAAFGAGPASIAGGRQRYEPPTTLRVGFTWLLKWRFPMTRSLLALLDGRLIWVDRWRFLRVEVRERVPTPGWVVAHEQ